MPFVPSKASVRTLYVPTTSSPALDLALASVRILLRLLLFFRVSDSLPFALRFSQTEYFPLYFTLRPARF